MRVVVAVVCSDDLLALLLCITLRSLSHNDVLFVGDDQQLHALALLPQHLRQAVHLVHVQRRVDLVRQQNRARLDVSSFLITDEYRIDRQYEGQQTQRLLPAGQPRVEGPRRVVQLALRSHTLCITTRKATPSEKAVW